MVQRLAHSRLPLLACLIGLAGFGFVYVLVLPQFQAAHWSFLTPADLYGPRIVDLVVAGWCFWVGSAIGSFLNVVAWRMPRGENVSGRSHCPRCEVDLRLRDNVPVWGWMIVGGRCRSCQQPISPRYPIVELVVGVLMMLVAIGEVYRISLPGDQYHVFIDGPLWSPRVDPHSIGLLIFHVYSLSVAWAFGLVRYDRHRLPMRLVAWGLGPVIAAMTVYPAFGLVTWRMGTPETTLPLVDSLVRVLTSLAAAGMVGRSLARGLCPSADPKLDPLGKSTARLIDLVVILCVPTLVFGWQAALAVIALASILAVVLHRRLLPETDRLGSFAIALPIVSSLYLFGWWRLDQWSLMPSGHSQPLVILAWAAVLLVAPLWLRSPELRATDRSAANEQDESPEDVFRPETKGVNDDGDDRNDGYDQADDDDSIEPIR